LFEEIKDEIKSFSKAKSVNRPDITAPTNVPAANNFQTFLTEVFTSFTFYPQATRSL
jgi:hypothetical protein